MTKIPRYTGGVKLEAIDTRAWREDAGIKTVFSQRGHDNVWYEEPLGLCKSYEDILPVGGYRVVSKTFSFLTWGYLGSSFFPRLFENIEKQYLNKGTSDFIKKECVRAPAFTIEQLEDFSNLEIVPNVPQDKKVFFFSRHPWEIESQTELMTEDLVTRAYARFEFLVI